jgi:hypothetical protein
MAAESASECSAGSDVELLRRDRSRGSFGSLSSLTQMDPKTQLVVEMQGGAYAPAPEMRGRPTRLTHGQLRYEYIGRGSAPPPPLAASPACAGQGPHSLRREEGELRETTAPNVLSDFESTVVDGDPGSKWPK